MKKIFHLFILLLIFPAITMAGCGSNSSFCYYTKLGVLDQITRHASNSDYSYLTLNGVKIYNAKTDYMSFDSQSGYFKNKKHIITKAVITFTLNEPCTYREYYGHCSVSVVLDFSGDKPVISNGFTPDSGNSVIDWVSWGKANAIIVFQDESKFKYEKGHVEHVLSGK